MGSPFRIGWVAQLSPDDCSDSGLAADFKCEFCKGTDGMDAFGPEINHVNWDHHPVRREHSIEYWPDRPWDTISEWSKNGNTGRLIDELENVRLLHRGCHPM